VQEGSRKKWPVKSGKFAGCAWKIPAWPAGRHFLSGRMIWRLAVSFSAVDSAVECAAGNLKVFVGAANEHWARAISNHFALFQDSPCLEGFSFESDGMPPIEARS
jgi:hypothetical protein